MTAPIPPTAPPTAPPAPPAAPAAPAAPEPPAFTPPASQDELDQLIGRRLNQERAKYKGLTPEQFTEVLDKAEKFDKESLAKGTDLQRATAEAAEAAKKEADAEYRPKLAETAFRVAIGDRKTADEVNDFIADLNLARFLTDGGDVDTAKVLARVEQFAGKTIAPPAPPAPRGPVIPGHNPGGSPPAKAGDAARAWLVKKGIQVD